MIGCKGLSQPRDLGEGIVLLRVQAFGTFKYFPPLVSYGSYILIFFKRLERQTNQSFAGLIRSPGCSRVSFVA